MTLKQPKDAVLCPGENPFYWGGKYYFKDGSVWQGPYDTEREAMHALLWYMTEHPTIWQRIRRLINRLWYDTRG